MVKPKNPCIRTCPKRNVTCHSTCKDYKDYKIELEIYNAYIRSAREDDDMGRFYIGKHKKRYDKKRGEI